MKELKLNKPVCLANESRFHWGLSLNRRKEQLLKEKFKQYWHGKKDVAVCGCTGKIPSFDEYLGILDAQIPQILLIASAFSKWSGIKNQLSFKNSFVSLSSNKKVRI